jgi:hypothetical protein
MYTFVDFTSQIVGWRGVPCPTNKGVSYTNLVCWLVCDLKNRLLLLLLLLYTRDCSYVCMYVCMYICNNNNNNLILRPQPTQTPNWCMRPPYLWDKEPLQCNDLTAEFYRGVHNLLIYLKSDN